MIAGTSCDESGSIYGRKKPPPSPCCACAVHVPCQANTENRPVTTDFCTTFATLPPIVKELMLKVCCRKSRSCTDEREINYLNFLCRAVQMLLRSTRIDLSSISEVNALMSEDVICTLSRSFFCCSVVASLLCCIPARRSTSRTYDVLILRKDPPS